MLDELSSLQNLAKFNVVLAGDWTLATHGQPLWSGEATAETAIVGILFLSYGNRLFWAKSGQTSTKIVPQVYESRPVSNKLSVELLLLGAFSLKAQFIYTLGHGNGIENASAKLNSKDYLGLIPRSRMVQTGQLFAFAHFDSTPTATLYAMFLAKQNIRMKRKRIWRLRTPLLESLTEPLREVFTYGRRGELTI